MCSLSMYRTTWPEEKELFELFLKRQLESFNYAETLTEREKLMFRFGFTIAWEDRAGLHGMMGAPKEVKINPGGCFPYLEELCK